MTREGPQRIGAQDIRPYDGFGSRAAVTMPARPRTVCPQLRTTPLQRSELAKSAICGRSDGHAFNPIFSVSARAAP